MYEFIVPFCGTEKKYLESLKLQSCKLYDNKQMIASTQITNPKFFAFIAVLVFKLLNRNFLFINIKDNRKC